MAAWGVLWEVLEVSLCSLQMSVMIETEAHAFPIQEGGVLLSIWNPPLLLFEIMFAAAYERLSCGDLIDKIHTASVRQGLL